jgi:hypothetical protein
MTRDLPTNDLIREILGDDHPIPLGWDLIIQTFTPGENFLANGEESLFERPDAAKDRDRYMIGVGRILMMGDACFKAGQFKDWGLIPEVGDYITFRKYQGVYNSTVGPNGEIVNNMDLKDYEVLRLITNPKKCGNFHFIGN